MNNFDEFKNQFNSEIFLLRKRYTFLLIFVLFLLSTTLILLDFCIKNSNSIRTKELLILDEYGNERIILSAQISNYSSRKRTDTLSGILVLDNSGNDRVIVGSSPTIKNNGKIVKRSIDGPYGLAFNDENGVEKGGFGYYQDKQLSILGLDGPKGEGIILFVPETELFNQKAGMIINDPQSGGQMIYIGANMEGQRMINLDVNNKGRFSITMDSTLKTNFKLYNYLNNSEETIISTPQKK